jgi:cytoskeletal protein CcmA (bactofilin family)
MRWHRRNHTAPETSTAFITEGSELEGTCSFNGSVVLSGHVKGEIHATGTLSVGRAGRVEARLHAPIVIIEGEVIGSVVATERIELREHARVRGDLETPALIIEESALFEGQTKPLRGHDGEVRGDGVAATRLRAPTKLAAASS